MPRFDVPSPAYWIGGWLMLLAAALLFWPLVPVDETRYLSVAWEMWLHNDFLVPHFNGETYSHKPPLLFWLIHAGWWVLGVNEWWPRLVPALFGLGALFLTRSLARQLWPGQTGIAALAPFILLGTQLWALFTPAVMFDLLLSFWVLAGLYGALRATKDEESPLRGWLITGVAIGFGILTKGPVVLLHILIPLLLAPWWLSGHSRRWWSWYAGMAGAVLLGAAIALAWALPAAFAGGPEFAKAIFWGQTAGRVSDSFAHARSWWWYLVLLPVLLFPWFVWPTLWRALARLFRRSRLETGVRFCLAWLLPVFFAFALVSGKQAHYLLPLFPAFALLSARALVQYQNRRQCPWPVAAGLIILAATLFSMPLLQSTLSWADWLADLPQWCALTVALLGVIVLVAPQFRQGAASVVPLYFVSLTLTLVLSAGIMRTAAHAYDPRPLAQELAMLEKSGTAIAYVGKYFGQFNFSGRLQYPLVVISRDELPQWIRDNPDGVVIQVLRDSPPPVATPLYHGPYRGQEIGLWRAGDFQG